MKADSKPSGAPHTAFWLLFFPAAMNVCLRLRAIMSRCAPNRQSGTKCDVAVATSVEAHVNVDTSVMAHGLQSKGQQQQKGSHNMLRVNVPLDPTRTGRE